MTTRPPWNPDLSTLLEPGGCLVVASGVSVVNPLELTIGSVEVRQVLNTSFATGLDDITIVHFWDVHPNTTVVGKALPCTVSPYVSTADIQGTVILPQKTYVSYNFDRLGRSFSYTIGCTDLPFNSTDGGAYYVQVWGQSHKFRQSLDGPWKPSTEPYRFDKILASSDKGGYFVARPENTMSDAKPYDCSAKTTTKVVTTVAPSTAPTPTRSSTTRASPKAWIALAISAGMLASFRL